MFMPHLSLNCQKSATLIPQTSFCLDRFDFQVELSFHNVECTTIRSGSLRSGLGSASRFVTPRGHRASRGVAPSGHIACSGHHFFTVTLRNSLEGKSSD